MRARPTSLFLALLACAAPLAAQAPAATGAEFQSAAIAWERGQYPFALRTMRAILRGPQGERDRVRIALLTGERHTTDSLAGDGRGVRVSGDGRWAAWESGPANATTTTIVELTAAGTGARATVSGGGLVLSAAGGNAAYLRGNGASQELVFRQLATGREGVLSLRDFAMVRGLASSADGVTLYFLGRSTSGTDTLVYAATGPDRPPRPVSATRVSGMVLTAAGDGQHLLVSGLGPRATSFQVVRIADGTVRTIAGLQPGLSADGRLLTWVARNGPEWRIEKLDLRSGGEPSVVRRSAMPLATPAPSPDGQRIAFAMMPREDWEIAVVAASGESATERLLTRELQHDRQPRWLDGRTLLSVKGEGRHQRSYLHDVESGDTERFFHNNTVRTIAPEYEWAVVPGGTRVLIVSERDGNTVSPERGVFLADRRREVTREQLLARVERQLAAEESLRALAARIVAPMRAQIRAVTDSVSIEHVYGYQKALFDFGSKHITQPGNRPAREWIHAAFRSFGYTPAYMEWTPNGAPPTANVLATLRGTTHPELVYVVGSHFDSRAEGPGADDNSSGTAMLLETARVLAKHPLPATVVFIAFSGEESGLLGSREFARRAKAEGWKVIGAMNNDMMGWSNDQRLDNTIRYSNAGIRDVQHAAALEFSKLITYDAEYYKSTDAQALYDAWGDVIGGFGSYPVLGNPHYHQPHDVLETINHELVTETTRANAATVMLLASMPSRVNGVTATRAGRGATVSWTANPEQGIAGYRVKVGDGAPIMVRGTRVTLPSVPAGATVFVKAVGARGMEGWDWGKVVVP